MMSAEPGNKLKLYFQRLVDTGRKAKSCVKAFDAATDACTS